MRHQVAIGTTFITMTRHRQLDACHQDRLHPGDKEVRIKDNRRPASACQGSVIATECQDSVADAEACGTRTAQTVQHTTNLVEIAASAVTASMSAENHATIHSRRRISSKDRTLSSRDNSKTSKHVKLSANNHHAFKSTKSARLATTIRYMISPTGTENTSAQELGHEKFRLRISFPSYEHFPSINRQNKYKRQFVQD